MEEAFAQYIENNYVVFSVSIKQELKNDIWKKNIQFAKDWQKTSVDSTEYDDNKNGLAMLTGKRSGIIVIDIDNVQHWKKLLKKHNKKEPDTVRAISASGGIHLYFKYSDTLKDIKTNTHSFG